MIAALAFALMMPGDFSGTWVFTSFQARPIALRISWRDDGVGFSRRTGMAWASRDDGGPLVIETDSGTRYLVTRASMDHRRLWGIVYYRDRVGTFRAHRRRP